MISILVSAEFLKVGLQIYEMHNSKITSSKIEELIEKCLEFVYLNTNQTILSTPSFSSVGDSIMKR